MDLFYKLKVIPSDFRVSENLVIPYCTQKSGGNYHYFKLLKCGLTTFEAIDYIAAAIGVSSSEVGYGGLKDEDGITEQTIVVPGYILPDDIEKLSGNCINSEKYIALNYLGDGNRNINIGDIQGNSFQVTIRGLEEKVVTILKRHRKNNFFFINYFDTQRFGIPNAPHVTHLIGQSLALERYEEAYEYLNLAKIPESMIPLVGNDYKGFFKNLDIRKQLFYRNSYSSYLWNEEIKKMIYEGTNNSYLTHIDEGFSFFFVKDLDNIANLLQVRDWPYHKFACKENEMVSRTSNRPIFIQSILELDNFLRDEIYEERWKCNVSFSLPSGSYATMAIKQFFHFIKGQITETNGWDKG